MVSANASRRLRPTCGASLTLPQTLKKLRPVPYDDDLGCHEHNVTCMKALNVVIHYAGGLLGQRGNVSESPAHVYGVGPAAASCSQHDDADDDAIVHIFPCVSSPFTALSYRDSCGLYVHAGCAGHGVEPWSRIGCQMHPGSRLQFRGMDDEPRLAGEWVVGPGRSVAQEGNTFWVLRADGEPHGLEESELQGILARRRSAVALARFQCVLETLPPRGESCCRRSHDYGACPALDPLGTTSLELGDVSVPLKQVLVDVGIGSVVVLLSFALFCICMRSSFAQRMRLMFKRRQLLPDPAPRPEGGAQAHPGASMEAQPQDLSASGLTIREVQIDLQGLPSWDVMYIE